MTSILQISHLVDLAVLQHIQDTFAGQKHLSVLLFDTRGEKVTKPSFSCSIAPELAPVLDPFLNFILTNPPHFADLGLREGNTVFASFFNGIFHRAILPLMVQRQPLGAVQLVAVNDLDAFDIGRWRYVLDGFSWNDVSYLAFLDSQPRAPLTGLVHDTAGLKTNLIDMLESGYSRYKKQLPEQELSGPVAPGQQEMVTNRQGDILTASPAMAHLLRYETAEEMIGLNAIEHLTIDSVIQEELRDALGEGESETLTEALIQTKDGLLLRVSWLIILEKDDEGNEVGLRWQIQRSTEVRRSRPDILPNLLKDFLKDRRTETGVKEEPAPTGTAGSGNQKAGGDEIVKGEEGEKEEEKSVVEAEAFTPAMLSFLEELCYPLFAVDSENRILVWNRQLVDLLKISPRAVIGLDFSNLLVGDSQKQWHQWLFEFRINPDLTEIKPGGLLYVLDNSGEVFAIRLELAKTDLPAGQVVTATIRSCEKSAPPPPVIPTESAEQKSQPQEKGVRREESRQERLEPSDALEALSTMLERQWQPLYERLTQLVRPQELDTARRDEARVLLQDAEALTRLLQQLHYIAGAFDFDAAPVPIVRILHYAANIQECLFDQPAHIIWQVPDEHVLAEGDTVMLYHAMVYLLDYVRKVMEEGTPLRIRIKRILAPEGVDGLAGGDQMVLIEANYTDGQSPWPAREKKLHSERYFRDFGLAAMQAIVQAHHGAVRIAPAEFEQRAFQLYLPLSSPDQRPSAAIDTILVIDDEPGIVQMNALMLGHAGYTVLSAMEGAEALRLLKEHKTQIRAVLLDWQLKDVTGSEMAGEIARISSVPLILTSGFLPDKEIKSVMQAYNARFVQKPYTTTMLVQAVNGAIKKEPS
jgi:CheY-like chemotaxis protein